MKKVMTKILVIFILFVMMFELVFSSNYSLAVSEETINAISNLAGGLVSILLWPKRIMIVGLSFVVDVISSNIASTSGVNYGDAGVFNVITPFDIFFNKYKLLDVNVFDINATAAGTIPHTIRTTVSGWYYVMRTISAAILLCILIYVGIRMALSTIAEDKAKYKKMLFDWVCSLALIFVLQYIAIFTIYCNNAIVNALRSLLTDTAVEDSLTDMIIDIGMKGVFGVGIPSMAAVLVFVFIVFQTIAFLIAYINRMLKVAFLVMISPLVSITYSIDKMGDGKAQALSKWLAEFIFTILIQPFHCLMYIAFVRTAFALITDGDITPLTAFTDVASLVTDAEYNELVNGVLAILCLKFINDGEKIVRKIFGFQDDNSGTSLAAGMAVGMLAVKNIKKAGQTARKSINFAKGASSRLGKAVGKDFGKDGQLRKNMPGLDRSLNRLEQGMNKASQKMDQITDKFNNSKFGKGVNAASKWGGKAINGAKTLSNKWNGSKIGKFVNKHNSLSSALGIMSAAMIYSSGDAGAMEAIGVGSAVNDSAAELFASSASGISKNNQELHERLDDKERAELEEKVDRMSDPSFTKAVSYYEQADKFEQEALQKQAEAEALRAEHARKEAERKKNRKGKQDHSDEDANQREAKAQKLMDKAAEFRKKAEEIDTDGYIKNAMENGEFDVEKADGTLASMQHGAEVAKQKAMEQLAHFDDKDVKKARYESRGNRVDKNALQAKKNEIIQKLTKIKLQQKNGDSKSDNKLTTSDMDSIERTAELLTKNIEMGVLQNGYSQEQQAGLVRNSLGLDSDTDGSMMSELYKATSDYEDLQMKDKIGEGYEYFQKMGGNRQDLAKMDVARSTRPIGKRRKSSESTH